MGVSCYLCGRDFGTASFGIHMVSCMERWSREQGGDQEVRQPSPPPGIEQALSGNLKGRQLIEFNRESVALWKALVLKPCSACSRTFFPGQLKKHERACRPNRPMGNPHNGPGRASQLEAGVSYPSYPVKRARSSNKDPLLAGSEMKSETKSGKKGMQNHMEEFLHAVTSKQPNIIEEEAIQKRPGTYCVSRDRSLIPWYRLTSVKNIQASLREFITTIQANSVMMDKDELDELLYMTSLLQTGSPAESRQQRRPSTVSILPPIKKGRKVSSRRRGSDEQISGNGRNGERRGGERGSGERRGCLGGSCFGGEQRTENGGERSRDRRSCFGGEESRKGSILSPLHCSSGPSRSFTYCSLPTVVF